MDWNEYNRIVKLFEDKERADDETRHEIALHSDMTSLDECE